VDKTRISWTGPNGATWNPWIGCQRVSEACDDCYMFEGQRRNGQNPEIVRRTTTTFKDPLKWVRNPRRYGHHKKIFTCSYSDFFITKADEWRPEAWEIIRRTPQFTYLILTHRPVLIPRRLPAGWGSGWPNCWLGVTVESRRWLSRLDVLRRVPAVKHFVSFEPLLEDLGEIDLCGIDWAIIGGKSGKNWKQNICDLSWIYRVIDQCRAQGVAVFVKQDSAYHDEQQGRLPDDIWRFKDFP